MTTGQPRIPSAQSRCFGIQRGEEATKKLLSLGLVNRQTPIAPRHEENPPAARRCGARALAATQHTQLLPDLRSLVQATRNGLAALRLVSPAAVCSNPEHSARAGARLSVAVACRQRWLRNLREARMSHNAAHQRSQATHQQQQSQQSSHPLLPGFTSRRPSSFGAGSRAHARWAELTHLFAADSPVARRLIERDGSPTAALAASSSGAPSRQFYLLVGCCSNPRALHENNAGRMQDRPPTALRREQSRSTSPGKLPAQSPRELASSQPFMHAGHSCGSAVRQSVRGTGTRRVSRPPRLLRCVASCTQADTQSRR